MQKHSIPQGYTKYYQNTVVSIRCGIGPKYFNAYVDVISEAFEMQVLSKKSDNTGIVWRWNQRRGGCEDDEGIKTRKRKKFLESTWYVISPANIRQSNFAHFV